MKKLFIMLGIILLTNNICFASVMGGYDAGSINSQYMRDLRIHEMATRERNKNAIINTSVKKENQIPTIPVASTIKTVKFINNNSISSSDLTRILSGKLNVAATEESIADIRSQVIKYYQANGFYSALAFPDTSNLKSGELILEIREGGKNSIVVE